MKFLSSSESSPKGMDRIDDLVAVAMLSVGLTAVVDVDLTVLVSELDCDVVGAFKGCVITKGDCSVLYTSINKDKR